MKSLLKRNNPIDSIFVMYTFSSETSRDFRLLPTTRNSSSSSTIFLDGREKEKIRINRLYAEKDVTFNRNKAR